MSVAPATGSTTGGTVIEITGGEFGADTAVTFAGVPAASVRVQSATSLAAVLGARSTEGVGDIVVTSGGKSAALAGRFRYYAPSGANQPPIVTGIRGVSSKPNQPSRFFEIDETISIIPTVANAEVGVTFRYEWTGPGTFTPAPDGTTAWRLPSTGTTPMVVTASLVVTELFIEIGIEHQQKAAPASFSVQVHDSRKEVLDMGEDFLTRFTRQLPADQTLHNFSPTCDGGRGRADEASDIELNRARFTQNVDAFRLTRRPPFSVNFKSVCNAGDKPPQPNIDACGSLAVHWEGYDRELGANFVTNGINYLSAVVENNQWRLCHSSFTGTASYPALGLTRAISW